MHTNQRYIKARENWIKCYEELGSVSKAALKCGIPRCTLYRWIKRFKENGKDALQGHSKCPKHLAKQKISSELTQLIISLRNQYNFGPQSISVHLLRMHSIEISPPTVWRVLKQQQLPNLRRYKGKNHTNRYSRPVPGDRVQIDVTKIAPSCYQFTAIDDCTRMRALKLYPNKKAEAAVDFLSYVLDTLQFPIQRVQVDWGTEFFNDMFQEELMCHFIKFRPIKPRSPHLNGKVERSHLTDKAEFYRFIPKKERGLHLADQLLEWQNFYNQKRPHSSLKGKTPAEKLAEVEHLIPIQPDVTAKYCEKEVDIIVRSSKWYYHKMRGKMSHMS
ncbi:MAG: IS481 family transposase [Williamsia sp.]|nr:IS481 family transposase [Williamsia sp.]